MVKHHPPFCLGFPPLDDDETTLISTEGIHSGHDNVKRTIEALAERGVFTLPQIEETSFAGVDGRNPTFWYNPRIPWQGATTPNKTGFASWRCIGTVLPTPRKW